jgi:hypothetical protein
LKTKRHTALLGVILFLVLISSVPAIGQNSFGLELTYVTGFQDREIKILDEHIDLSMPHGAQLTVVYSKRIKDSPWLAHTGIGGKYMSIRGQTSNQLNFLANSFKVNALLGTRYQMYPDLSLGAQFIIESNRDFGEITYLKSDIWRYYVCLEAVYTMNKKWNAVIKYWRSISSNDDVYLLFTPINQISIGANYYFHEI